MSEIYSGPWPDEHVADDFETAIGESEWGGRVAIYSTAVPGGGKAEPIDSGDVAEVTDWFVSYHDGGRYVVGSGHTGTELDLVAVLRLKDGRWVSVQAWNDYTGWGCGEGSNVAIGSTRDQVVRFGLDDEGRRKLGIEVQA